MVFFFLHRLFIVVILYSGVQLYTGLYLQQLALQKRVGFVCLC